SDFLHQQDFIFIAVSLNIAGIDRLQRNWPLNLANFPTRWQFPFQFSWKTGVARERPISVPLRSHSKQQPDREWLARNNRAGISQKLSLHEFLSLVNLRRAMWRRTEDRPSS